MIEIRRNSISLKILTLTFKCNIFQPTFILTMFSAIMTLFLTNAHWLCFQKHIPDCDCQLYSLTLATVDGLVRRTDGNWAGTTYKLPSLVCVSLCGNAKKADMSVSFPCQFFIDCDIVSDLCTKKVVFRKF